MQQKNTAGNAPMKMIAMAILFCIVITLTLVSANISAEMQTESFSELSATGDTADLSRFDQVYLPENPKEDIDRTNISNYVPIEYFNKNGTVLTYLGENYGFIVQVDGTRNRVMLFTVSYTNHENDNGFDLTLEVVYENCFSLLPGGLIWELAAGENLALGVVALNSTIINSTGSNIYNVDYQAEQDKGAYFVQSDYHGLVSEIGGDDIALDAATTMTGMILDLATRSVPVVGQAIGYVMDFASIAHSASIKKTMVYDEYNAVNWPVEADDQIQSYGALAKSISAVAYSEGAKSEGATYETTIDQLTARRYLCFDEDNTNSLTFSFRIANPNDIGYYVQNLLRFNVYSYSIIEPPKKLAEFSTTLVSRQAAEDTAVQSLNWKDDLSGFVLSEGQNVTPLLNGAKIEFTAKKEGNYRFSQLNNYSISVQGMSPQSDGSYYLAQNQSVRLNIGNGTDSDIVDQVVDNAYFLEKDFLNGKIEYAGLFIWRDQDVSFDDTELPSGLTYMPIINDEEGNNVYSIATSNTSDIEMYITDSEFNILAQGQKIGGKIVVNFPMLADEKYYLVCENKAGSAVSATFFHEGDLTIGDTDYEGVPMYYRVDARYTQQYHIYGDVPGVFTAAGELHSDTGYDVFMQQGKSYYVLSTGADDNGEDLAVDFEDDVPVLAGMGQNYIGAEGYNSVYEFVPKVTARYAFAGGKCDVYVDGAMTASAIDEVLLEQGKRYTIVKCDTASAFSLIPNVQTIIFDQQFNVTDALDHAVYAFQPGEQMRVDIDISNGTSYLVCDSAMNVLDFDHGYYLMAATYYIIVAEGGDYALRVKEYLQPIEIDLIVDGQPFADNSGAIYYYGKPFTLPVPADKVGYEFDGWFDGETAYTNAGGQSVRAIYAESITLEAHWTAKGVVIRMDPDTLESAWWIGDEIVYNEPEAIQEEGLAALTLVNLIKAYSATAEGRSEGYYISEFVLTQVDDDGDNFYYVLEADFAPKKYSVTFVLNDNDTITRTMTYGDVPTSAWEEEIFGGSNYIGSWDSWVMPIGGVDQENEIVEFEIGQSIPDLFTINTPMIGDEVYFPVTLTRNMNYVQYQLAIDGTTKTYDVDDTGCVLPQTIEELGLNEQNYYGYNVLFATTQDDASFKYTMGATVSKSDLYRFWTDGAMSVRVELAIEKTLIDYRIVYSYGRNNDNFNATKAPIILSDVSQRGWYFAGWTYDDQYITQIDLASIGENKVYSSANGISQIVKQVEADFRRTVYEASSVNNELTITSSVGVAYVDCYGVLVNVLGEFTIAPSVNEVTFDGGGAVWRDSKIVVQARTTPLTINFSNISVMAKSSDVVLDARDCMDLTIYSYNNVTLTSGEGGQEGQFAAVFVGGDLTLDGENITIEGSNQTVCTYNENNYAVFGIIGGLARHYNDNTMHVKAKNVYVYGGDGIDATQREDIDGVNGSAVGEKGGDGNDGVDGGDGAYGIMYNGTLIVDSGSYLYSEGGDGGNGTRGGHGGKGGPGKDGEWFGATAVNSGDGGNGGAGGNGGDGGWGILVAELINNGKIDAIGGTAGKGGTKGNGGTFGEPGKTVFGNDAKGNNGTPGTDGYDGSPGPDIVWGGDF